MFPELIDNRKMKVKLLLALRFFSHKLCWHTFLLEAEETLGQ